MTLLELVVALTITGITVTAGYGALASILDHRAAADARMDAVTRAAARRRMLVAWLRGARVTQDQNGPSFRGLDGTFQGQPDDELSFLTTAETPSGAGETVVRLFIDRDILTAEDGLTADLSVWRGAQNERVEIEPSAGGLDFRYATHMLGREEWLPSWISSTVLPAAAELVVLARPNDSLPGLLRLPITAPIGAGR